jgi:hypothetical protein
MWLTWTSLFTNEFQSINLINLDANEEGNSNSISVWFYPQPKCSHKLVWSIVITWGHKNGIQQKQPKKGKIPF